MKSITFAPNILFTRPWPNTTSPITNAPASKNFFCHDLILLLPGGLLRWICVSIFCFEKPANTKSFFLWSRHFLQMSSHFVRRFPGFSRSSFRAKPGNLTNCPSNTGTDTKWSTVAEDAAAATLFYSDKLVLIREKERREHKENTDWKKQSEINKVW